MCSKTKTTPSTKEYSDKIELARFLIQEAERLVIGVGSGLSAAGGLDYADPELLKRWFPEYYSMGFRGIYELLGQYWQLNRSKPEAYWGVWARHIQHIRYNAPPLQPYQNLFALTKGKPYFIVSTNVDGQLQKAGFPSRNIFAPQGEYRYFQCSKPCSDDVYDNEEMIKTMVANMPSPLEIRTQDIPTCPKCGRPLVPNLRCDNTFVEKPYIQNMGAYAAFLEECKKKQTVFLELGVGYNTPGIIRYPFQQFVSAHPKSNLVRINLQDATTPPKLENQSVNIQANLADVLADLKLI